MPYSGPSKGCRRCICLKVKCDENRPNCLRCTKATQECEYRDEFDLILRNQNRHAAETAKTRWRQRAAKSKLSSSLPRTAATKLVAPSQQVIPSSSSSSSIPKPVTLRSSFQQMVHLRFFYDFANAQDRGTATNGALDRIPQMMAASSPDSWFHSAMSALSFANFGGRLKSQEAKNVAAVFYNNALGRFARVMSSSASGKTGAEQVLFGIFLLGIYELMYCLANKEPPPSFLADIQLHNNSDPRSELTALMYCACKLRHKFAQQSSLLENDNLNEKPQGLYPLFQEAMDLDKALEEWHQRTSRSGWAFTRSCFVNAQSRPQWARELFSLPGAPKEMLIYNSLLAALSTNLYCSTRLLLNLSILEWARTIVSSPLSTAGISIFNESIATSTAALLMELINDLCMGVPFMLQLTAVGGMEDPQLIEELYSLRGILTLWPLVAAMACLQDKEVQKCDVDFKRAWVQHLLTFLKNSVGLAKAQAFITMYN
ncbi:uncharacterized protein TRIVIDRAFT_60130 [Trichoderma virens Gv29-8]|uniref:Zn(2)-C6 fungal-type domain-containing protein n=1 Tax=Hypocrea virens (strain Gv29-8 / FGSC 10586) TaxID=413071 RepID=G9MSV3_HYPVG|nr:uncharacterized protein TRIVIDRAFT_60130 [Trichoderma virens Gv29-8]EHK23050.1 hypothetical protein TRIVIDRAFT_60130 [Trichoderma virens Gv29-8]UKZ48110.1 hypothetical protein TrVGV298_002346 [Trichoderma virens]